MVIELPEGANYHKQAHDRVDVFLFGDDKGTYGDETLKGWLTFRKYETGWVMAHGRIGEDWKVVQVPDSDVPEVVKEMIENVD